MNFSTRLKELRKSKKVNQVEAGQVAGITSKQIRRYESGDSEPKINVLLALADYFDVSMDVICGRKEY